MRTKFFKLIFTCFLFLLSSRALYGQNNFNISRLIGVQYSQQTVGTRPFVINVEVKTVRFLATVNGGGIPQSIALSYRNLDFFNQISKLNSDPKTFPQGQSLQEKYDCLRKVDNIGKDIYAVNLQVAGRLLTGQGGFSNISISPSSLLSCGYTNK